jgi:serine/threonine protein kinase/Tol biopolymer transport system component
MPRFMTLAAGTRLGSFEIVARLGAGGMGEVYRARDTKLGRDVALKVLPSTFLQDPERLARFRREAQVLASLNHPNIAAIYGLEESGSQPALVLELVEGPTLADHIAGRTPEAENVGSRPRDQEGSVIGRRGWGPGATKESERVIPRGGGAPRGVTFEDPSGARARSQQPGGGAPRGLPEAERVSARLRDPVAGPARGGGAPRGLEIDDTLNIARQIVAALEEAHARGVVHRDLKPANISVRDDGTVKVLDFGLAKLADASPGVSTSESGTLANSPTMTSPAMTAMGMILGTAAYMSPEQAKGRVVDKRADIWAFGCVLYEMLTGRPVFEGDDVTDTMAAILRGEPDWDALPAGLPAPIHRLLRRCLVKDPVRRLPDIGAARFELDDALSSPAEERKPAAVPPVSAAPPARRWPERAALGVITLGLVVMAVLHFGERPEPRTTFRFQVSPAPDTLFAGGGGGAAPTVSPDGRLMIFRAFRTNHQPMLWLRNLETMDTREVAGTEAASAPFWSPDGRSIGFFADRKLKRVELSGGAPQTLANLSGVGVGTGTWSPDGTTIVFSTDANAGLVRIPAAGGPTTPITKVDTARKEQAHLQPMFLPDGRRFLFRAFPIAVEIASLDSGERTRLLDFDSPALFAPPGYLLFVRQDRVVAQRFDASTGQLRGEPVPLVDQVQVAANGHASVSSAGVLVYQSGNPQVGGAPVWVDRTGREIGTIGSGLNKAQYPRLSPDGQRLAVVEGGDIWVHDVRGRPPIRLTFGGRGNPAFSPLWTPDGRRLVYEVGGTTATPGLWSLPADGSERTASPASAQGHFHPHGWPADGREILAVELAAPGGTPDIVAIRTGEPFEKRAVVQTPAVEGQSGASLSPDGRWLAYVADPTGSNEIWVRPFPGPGAAVRISPDGGVEPIWSRNGRELFYRQAGRLMTVSVQAGSEFQFTPPAALFDSQFEFARPGIQPPTYDVAPDGRFVFLKPPTSIQSQPIIVIVNWADELERRTRPE